MHSRDATAVLPPATPTPLIDGAGALIARTWTYRVAPFREAFLTSGLDGAEIDLRCGWAAGHHRRVLGLRDDVSTRRLADGRRLSYRSRRQTVSYDTAVALCRALRLDFTEWGV